MWPCPPPLLVKGGIGYSHFSGGYSTIYSSTLIRKGENGYIAYDPGRNIAVSKVKNGSRTPAIVKLKNFDSSNVNKMGVADI